MAHVDRHSRDSVGRRLPAAMAIRRPAAASEGALLSRVVRKLLTPSARLVVGHAPGISSRALEQCGDSVLITDNDGIIEYVNTAFETMTGFTRQEVIGRKPSILRSGLQTDDFYKKLWETILSGNVFRSILTNRRRDGTLFVEDQTITPIASKAGQITHFVSSGRDITERRRTHEALHRLNQQHESQSARIAGILHDEAGQFLTSAHLKLAEVCAQVVPEVRAKLLEVRSEMDQLETRLREISHGMHPRIIEELGLERAVAFCLNQFSRRASIPAILESPIVERYSPQIETLIYRLLQEGLTNIIRHAHATRATIRIWSDARKVFCSIRDDGQGFDQESLVGRSHGLGLLLMQDRLEAAGGSLTTISVVGRGTELLASIPVED